MLTGLLSVVDIHASTAYSFVIDRVYILRTEKAILWIKWTLDDNCLFECVVLYEHLYSIQINCEKNKHHINHPGISSRIEKAEIKS